MHINFNCFGLGLNGGSRIICELANRLVDKDFQVTITCVGLIPFTNFFSKPLKANIVEIRPSTVMRAFRKWYLRSRGWEYETENLLLKNIPDCDVNVATACMTAYPTYFSGLGKMVYLVQNYEPLFSTDPRIQKKAEFTYSLPMKKLCVSKWLTEKVSGIYIGDGLDLNQFKLDTNIERRESIMGLCRKGKGMFWKNSDVLEKVFSELRKKGYETTMPEKVDDINLIRLYNSTRVFVFLSNFEGFGLPPLEAMACGAAVITSSCLEYAKHLENAFVLPEGYTVTDVVDAVEKVSSDNQLWRKLTNGGLETAHQFDINKMVDNFVQEIQ